MAVEPVFIATWRFGVQACQAGWEQLRAGKPALDAIEAAGNVTEDDTSVNSVGNGGLPNADGEVELDAAIMDGPTHAAGAVASLTRTNRPISVARRIMECTPHVMLVGSKAQEFARHEGFPDADLLSEASRKRWEEWKQTQTAAEVAHFEVSDSAPSEPARIDTAFEDAALLTPDNHDTIGLCALDADGNLAVGCTTSGMAWKVPGRVGDSPIIGSGLYVDNAIGACAGTGEGDEMMKACLSYRVVMSMERGLSPEEACIEALRYLLRKRPSEQHNFYGAALVALRKDGAYGAAATLSGFRGPDRLWQWAVIRGSADGTVEPAVALREGVYVTSDKIISTLTP
ncbi:MAG: Asparaginase [Chthonomonadaceae bacterium]|nr:Asparaginase [Chthonomonadaceae bacterium]